MAAILKVEEWRSPTGRWYVADVHTWTGWRECADILDVDTLEDYIKLLKTKYKAEIYGTIGIKNEEPANVLFNWSQLNYVHAHQFKLDINRIARNKKYMVE